MSTATTPVPRSIEELAVATERPALRIDVWLAVATLGLIGCSLYVLHGATKNDIPGRPDFYVQRQGLYAGIGLLLAIVLAKIDYSRLRELKFVVFGLLIGSNLLVLAIAGATRGSKRWINLPFFQYQPSEVGKVLLVVALAAFVTDRSRRLHERQTTARVMLLALLPALLVIAQPDLGTGMVFVVVAFAMLYFAGTSWKHLTALAALFVVSVTLVLAAAPAIGVHVLKPYQVQRLTGFLKPSKDPRNQTYQINQSEIAIGSGGKSGRGVAHATQTKLNFLPEHHTDFVFSVVGETYGFMGAAVVLSLYALLIWRALRILTMAKNLYGTLIAGGILAMMMFQVFVNVGMTIGIMPITGVPLPLMSFGGSSMLVTLMAIGLLQSIHIQARIANAGKGRIPLSQG
ncbi:MAG: rod shape-determining protein RodA [Solirubrobacterales bacterium]|jgi:rod shape determining protein RodA|nr:rod shape-determining protein RodA [Solirubrobacterales bacterium]